MTVQYGKDLFSDGNKVIVIPTNSVGAQGAGLAKHAALKWPAWDQWYKSICKDGHVSPGQIRFWCGSVAKHLSAPVVVSMATKNHWRDPSQLEWVQSGLKALEAGLSMACRESVCGAVLHGRGRLGQGTTVGLPAVGCGYGSLDYSIVCPLIEESAERLSQLGYIMNLYKPR